MTVLRLYSCISTMILQAVYQSLNIFISQLIKIAPSFGFYSFTFRICLKKKLVQRFCILYAAIFNGFYQHDLNSFFVRNKDTVVMLNTVAVLNS